MARTKKQVSNEAMAAMATVKNGPTVQPSGRFPIAQVYWDKSTNMRDADDYGDSKELSILLNSLSERNWVSGFPALAYQIDQKGIDKAIKERTKTLERLEKEYESSDGINREERFIRYNLYKELYFDKDGKPIEPRYYGNSGFRRSTVIFDSWVMRIRKDYIEKRRTDTTFDYTKVESLVNEIDQTIPIFVENYVDEIQRIFRQQQENEFANVGKKGLSDLNKLKTVQRLYKLKVPETRLRELYQSTTTVQKLYTIVRINELFPEVNLISNLLCSPDDKERYIPYGPIDHNDLRHFIYRREAEIFKNRGLPLGKKHAEQANNPIQLQTVIDYFNKIKDGISLKSPTMLSKKKVEDQAKNIKTELVGKVLGAVASGNETAIAQFEDCSTELNKLTNLVETDKGTLAKLASFSDYPKLVNAVNSALGRGIEESELIVVINSMKRAKS